MAIVLEIGKHFYYVRVEKYERGYDRSNPVTVDGTLYYKVLRKVDIYLDHCIFVGKVRTVLTFEGSVAQHHSSVSDEIEWQYRILESSSDNNPIVLVPNAEPDYVLSGADYMEYAEDRYVESIAEAIDYINKEKDTP